MHLFPWHKPWSKVQADTDGQLAIPPTIPEPQTPVRTNKAVSLQSIEIVLTAARMLPVRAS